jgi:tetratricopeptide (TPR) repeat protein
MSKSVENSNQQPSAPVDEATKFFLGAKSALKIGDMGAAERLLRKALELSPKNYLYMLTLARLLVQMDKSYSESEKLLLQSNSLNITAVEPRLILSALYEKQGRIRETQAILKSVINLEPKNFVARRKLSQLKGEFPVDNEQNLFRNEIFAQCNLLQSFEQISRETQVETQAETLTQNQEPEKENISDLNNISSNNETVTTRENISTNINNSDITNEVNFSTTTETEIESESETDQADTISKILTHLPETPRHIEDILNVAQMSSSENVINSAFQAIPLISAPTTQDTTAQESSATKDEFLIESKPQDVWSSNSEETKVEVLRLEVERLLIIVRRFFEGVKESLGEDTAFLLISRAKMQIESLYPELDYFSIFEDDKVVGFASSDKYVGKRTLEAIATWMYLYMTLLSETAILREEAGIRVINQVLKEDSEIVEEQVFYRYFTDIQL